MEGADGTDVEGDHRKNGNEPQAINLGNKNPAGVGDPGEMVEEFQIICFSGTGAGLWRPLKAIRGRLSSFGQLQDEAGMAVAQMCWVGGDWHGNVNDAGISHLVFPCGFAPRQKQGWHVSFWHFRMRSTKWPCFH